MLRQGITIIIVSCAGLTLAACNTTQERVGGAGAGALVGSVAGPPGAAVGAVGGAIVGPTVSNATIDRPRHKRRIHHVRRHPPPQPM